MSEIITSALSARTVMIARPEPEALTRCRENGAAGGEVTFDSVEDALEEIRAGRLVIVADDEGERTKRSYLCGRAGHACDDQFYDYRGQGVGLPGAHCRKGAAAWLADDGRDEYRISEYRLTVTIDADTKYGVTTGISAHDRAKTIRVAVDTACNRKIFAVRVMFRRWYQNPVASCNAPDIPKPLLIFPEWLDLPQPVSSARL